MRNRWLAASGLAAAAVVGLAACGGGGSSSSTPSSSSTSNNQAAANSGSSGSNTSATASGIKLTTISGHKVLTDSAGFVLYWFVNDTATQSNCSGSCLTYWPVVTGTPSAAAGVTLSGKLGTITRTDGTVQATYAGHPLYIFKADAKAGMDSGNGLNEQGGLWWAMTSSGAKIKATSSGSGGSSGGSGGGGGGYGY
jgi:predicted lipoprotein with Yx(FWY)xxD motif